jgi:glutathione S-transferase
VLKLYTAKNSICTQKVFITLAEKGLPYDIHTIDLFANEQYKPEYLKINPKGVVPALDHDGAVVIESSLICEYLDETFPAVRLVPADPFSRARMRLWSKEVDEHLFAATRELSFSAMFRERMRNMTEDQRQARFSNVGESTYEQGVESPYVYQGIAVFERAFDKMEKDLAAGGPWLVGTDLSLADVNMAPFVARLGYLDLLDLWIADRPATQTWWARMQARPSFKVAIPDRLTEADITAMRTFGGAIRDRVSERRSEYMARPKATA